MLTKILIGSCLVGSLLGAQTIAAQTGRIAHFSHGGSTAALAVADNFGLPENRSEYNMDSLVYLNDSMAISYGRYRAVSFRASDAELKKAPWSLSTRQLQYYSGQYQPQRWQEAVQALQQQQPRVKQVGFDKQLKIRGRKKSSSRSQAFPLRPFQYSFWRSAAGVAGLGAVGWLLGRKRAA